MWKVEYEPKARKNFKKLDKTVQIRIQKFINEKLSVDPAKYSIQLVGTTRNLSRARVGDYRLIFEVRHLEIIILVLDIDHRKDIYSDL